VTSEKGGEGTDALFRRAMRELAAGVTIIPTRAADGLHGLTATAVTCVAADPHVNHGERPLLYFKATLALSAEVPAC
jgi:hypothetical protein